MRFPCSALLRAACFLSVATAPVALAGCGKSPGDASGKVTYQGKPVVCGTIQFEGSDGMLKQSNISSDGTYSVQGVAAGDAKVAVSSRNPKSSDFQVIQREGMPPPPPRPEVKGWFSIPDKYELVATSELVYTIKSGANTIDIELK